jgi:membrane-associated HD superfamily phosphohydrolase
MNWDIYDYIAAVLFALFILIGIISIQKLASSSRARVLGIMGVFVIAGLAWAQLAVGLV